MTRYDHHKEFDAIRSASKSKLIDWHRLIDKVHDDFEKELVILKQKEVEASWERNPERMGR
jgi:hypothetical protein